MLFVNAVAAWLSGNNVGLWMVALPWPIPDLRFTIYHCVGKLSAMSQPPGQLSFPSLLDR